jgi:acyl-CoA reductase-like NAD-dependent aldehyde dehydrogenase
MKSGQLFIEGEWRAPASGQTYATINPATEEESAQVARGDERDVHAAAKAARKAFESGPWPRMAAADRAGLVWKLGDLIVANLDEMARLESLGTGKTLELPLPARLEDRAGSGNDRAHDAHRLGRSPLGASCTCGEAVVVTTQTSPRDYPESCSQREPKPRSRGPPGS